jgi:hypothetical protein
MGLGQRIFLWRLRHNTAGQPVVVAVVEIEPRLKAGDIAWARAERRHHFLELIGFGPVFRVVDDDVGAANEAKRVIASLELRSLYSRIRLSPCCT